MTETFCCFLFTVPTAVHLQNENAKFHKVGYRHYTGEAENAYISVPQIYTVQRVSNFITLGRVFTARAYARAVLGVVILSVRLSHAWIVTNLNGALQIFLSRTKGQSLCYSDTQSGWSATPPSLWNLRSKWPTPFEERRLRQISAHNVSTVGDSEKRSITTNIKSTTGFPTSHRWNAFVTPKCPKGWLKERFFRFLGISQRLIVSSAVNFVCRSVL